MKPDITDVIAYEIKKDIADRYFGFRKLIEQDKLDLEKEIRIHSFILEKRISFDLIRLYIILKDEELIDSFLSLTGIDKKQFYDPHFIRSTTIRNRVFEGIKVHGLTRSGRFHHLAKDCYERLELHSEQYRQKFAELKKANENIAEEIEVFYQQNDLGSIMGFLSNLGSNHKMDGMEGGMEIGMAESLEKKMAIAPLLPIENYLPVIKALPPLAQIVNELNKLLDRAYKLHDEESLNFLTSKKKTTER
ncbi:MAG: hypothetical protein KKC76_18705 [Proteobacteria bacterium]|nr:hypothetical protein [Pseudomonadota bacterium]MBU4295240.1 hypothetical protein [Pseudomonadota bacterium]MCG2750174.1 hypothetical protein [Desulfobulbaceae bacterium]